MKESRKEPLYTLVMVDEDIMQTARHKSLIQIAILAEEKGYRDFRVRRDNVFVGQKKDSIAVILEPTHDVYFETIAPTAISAFDEIVFRQKFKKNNFKEIIYKNNQFIVDNENRVVRQSSREKEIIIGGEYTIIEDGIPYEKAFHRMLEIMNKKIKQELKNENKEKESIQKKKADERNIHNS